MARALLAASALRGCFRGPQSRAVGRVPGSPRTGTTLYSYTTDVYPASTEAAGVALALGDLAFLVGEVLSARGAELLDLELLGHGPLVLRGRVVRSAALA